MPLGGPVFPTSLGTYGSHQAAPPHPWAISPPTLSPCRAPPLWSRLISLHIRRPWGPAGSEFDGDHPAGLARGRRRHSARVCGHVATIRPRGGSRSNFKRRERETGSHRDEIRPPHTSGE